MLGKLIKHEFKSMNRYLIPLHLGIIAVTLFGCLFINLRITENTPEPIFVLLVMTYAMLLIVATVTTFILIIVRFYKNLFTDEGYLMFTLPVKPWQHIVSKGTAAFVWMMVNFILVVFSTVLICVQAVNQYADGFSFARFWEKAASEYQNYFGHSLAYPFLLLGIYLVVSCISGILTVYACIAVGQIFTKHKIIGAVGIYFIIYLVLQILGTITTMLFNKGLFESLLFEANARESYYITVQYPLLMGFITSVILGIACYFTANYMMNKKLNLE